MGVDERVDGDAAAGAARRVVLHHHRRRDPQPERHEPRDTERPHVQGRVSCLVLPDVPPVRGLKLPVR